MGYEIPTIQGLDLAGIDRAVSQNKLLQMQMEAAKRQDEQATQKQNALKAMMDSLPADQRLLATIAPEKWAERQADPWYGYKFDGGKVYAKVNGVPKLVAGGITLEGMDAPMAPMGGAPMGSSPAPSAAPSVPTAKVPEVFRDAINAHAERTGLDPELLGRTIGAESNFKPNAVSPKGATGLAQVMPGTGRDPGFGVQPMKDSTPDENLRFGADYLKAMSDRYSGNVPVALAAYNWGPGNVDKWLETGADPRKLPAETQAYIAKITGRPFSGLTQTAQTGGTATDAGGGAARPRLFLDENGKPISAGEGLVWAQNSQGQRVAVPAPGSEVRDLTPAEIKARGLTEGTLAQIDGKGKVTVVKEGKDGPINASGLDAAMLNIVLQGDPNTPEYAAAYAHLTQPKPMQTQLPDGTVQMVMVTPSLPPNIRKPAWMEQGGTPAVPTGGAPAAPSQAATMGKPPAQPGAAPQQGNGYTVTPIAGASKDPKFTEGETNAYGFQQRMRTAENTIRDLEGKGYTQPGLKDRAAEAIPVFGHGLTSSDYQQFDSAKRDFITAVLRKESGAAIGRDEYDNEEKKYFPMPGDKPAVIEQKRIARQNAIKAMQAAAQGPMKFYDKGGAAPQSVATSPAGVPPLPPGFQIIGGQ